MKTMKVRKVDNSLMANKEKNKNAQECNPDTKQKNEEAKKEKTDKPDTKSDNKKEKTDKPDIKVVDKKEKTDECDTLKKNLADEKDKYLRLMAEYDNFRKRTAKEKANTFSDATVKTISDILPVYDNFERALDTQCSDENFKKGVEMIFNQFTECLNKMGVEVINPVGEEFNPDVAQAVNQVQDENLGENVVSQVFQKGYKLGEKIIRYAMVVVANP